MDADGQDRAEDLTRLLERFRAHGTETVIFAERARRREKMWFQALYYTYRWLHRVRAGEPVKVGSFSVVPRRRRAQLAVIPEIWNHYAASVIRMRIWFETVPIARWRREQGRSRMGFVGLLLLQLLQFALLLIFIVVGSRAHARFLPARDCPAFEGEVETLFGRDETAAQA